MSINEGYMRVVDINAKADLEKQQEARDKLASNSHLQDYMKALRVAFRGIMGAYAQRPFLFGLDWLW